MVFIVQIETPMRAAHTSSKRCCASPDRYDNPQELTFLMSETWCAVLLDCGAGKTVCSK